ncbi:hypothetical protein BDZ94DRAFT_238013 [Collybia nuda]|uniref:Response regulatory domain-containing protein n=1 Tax=Collybia nuda TaxID=64659 RepID=A0A9P5XTL1_9AGAR|nr:hypothetical protein BDZ94DRAFT_238013 [Collybia nuda]
MGMVGMGPEVGRATLEQMSEMSRRAGEVGFSFDVYANGSVNAHASGSSSGPASGVNPPNHANASNGITSDSQGQGQGQTQEQRRRESQPHHRPTSRARIWQAAAEAGLVSGAAPNGEIPPGALTGDDLLARLEGWGSAVVAGGDLGRMPTQGRSQGESQGQGQPQGHGQGEGEEEEEEEEEEEVVMPTLSNNPTPPVSAGHPPRSWPGESSALAQHEGLQVYTVGHLMPRGVGGEDVNGVAGSGNGSGSWSFDASALAGAGMMGGLGVVGGQGADQGQGQGQGQEPQYGGYVEEETVQPSPASSSGSGSASGSGSSTAGKRTLRVRRSTFVPGWAVPPRVLLVDDDAVSRRLSSKFLQVFGCTIDVAVDGVGAVNKMNLEKYDLVLMDIVMPKLDGVSATSLIRKFDHMTPIISMTSNSKPNEIMTYYSSGMNDILPKPFTKEGLLDMLEVRCLAPR